MVYNPRRKLKYSELTGNSEHCSNAAGFKINFVDFPSARDCSSKLGSPLAYSESSRFKFQVMTQDERWLAKYNEVKTFIEENHRNPSKHRIEEHDMLNWFKTNRKKMNAEALREPRLSKFKELLKLVEKYKHVNQYK